jgi:hypothetical protein
MSIVDKSPLVCAVIAQAANVLSLKHMWNNGVQGQSLAAWALWLTLSIINWHYFAKVAKLKWAKHGAVINFLATLAGFLTVLVLSK